MAAAVVVMFGLVVVTVTVGTSGRATAPVPARPATDVPGPLDGSARARLAGDDHLLPLSDPLPLDLAGSGYDLPEAASLYAARILDGVDGGPSRYVDYVAGGGALARDFWPASSVKLLAALGALDFAASLGFTGAATVGVDAGYTWTLREIYQSALVDSDNLDYDMLIRIAGFDRLNADFLSPANGFPTTVIQRSYAGLDVRWSPEMTFEEDGRTLLVPAREGTGEYDCPDEGNCTDLFELSEAVRRLVLDPSVAPAERFAVSPADIDALATALTGAGAGSFFAAGVERVFGPGATVQGKPGVAYGRDCVDTAVVTTPAGDRYLLSATIPDDDFEVECEGLSDLAAAVLGLLASP
ncbi:MAG: Beta-lactamase enzyme family [Actinomycetota bacterium]|nr:Beta-lactamase enzyme family [Actinomycetota bacterium]